MDCTRKKTAAVADATGVSGGNAGMLALPAAFSSAANRPTVGLSELRRGNQTLILRELRRGNETLILRVLGTDEASQRESFREAQCIHRKEAVDVRFVAAGIRGNLVENVAYATPVSGKDPVQPERRAGHSLRIRQLGSRGCV